MPVILVDSKEALPWLCAHPTERDISSKPDGKPKLLTGGWSSLLPLPPRKALNLPRNTKDSFRTKKKPWGFPYFLKPTFPNEL